MKPKPALKLRIENANKKNLELLKRAKRGDPKARKTLREMGMLYWEHQGRVIVRRLWPNNGERNPSMLWSLSRSPIYLR